MPPESPKPPARPPAAPPRPFARDEQMARLLTAASIQFRRGQSAEAEKSVREIIAVRPSDAAAQELLADILLGRDDLAGAQAALQAALAAEPGRPTAEAKLGRLALRRTEHRRLATLGVAYAASDTALMRLSGGSRKNSQWAAFGSALVPGLGQYVNGETTKGIVLAAVYFLGLALLSQLPDTKGLAHQLSRPFLPGARAGRAFPTPVSGTTWLLLFLIAADWLYAVVDAALASRRAAALPTRDGWQV